MARHPLAKLIGTQYRSRFRLDGPFIIGSSPGLAGSDPHAQCFWSRMFNAFLCRMGGARDYRALDFGLRPQCCDQLEPPEGLWRSCYVRLSASAGECVIRYEQQGRSTPPGCPVPSDRGRLSTVDRRCGHPTWVSVSGGSMRHQVDVGGSRRWVAISCSRRPRPDPQSIPIRPLPDQGLRR
jgi:hypothetical protein